MSRFEKLQKAAEAAEQQNNEIAALVERIAKGIPRYLECPEDSIVYIHPVSGRGTIPGRTPLARAKPDFRQSGENVSFSLGITVTAGRTVDVWFLLEPRGGYYLASLSASDQRGKSRQDIEFDPCKPDDFEKLYSALYALLLDRLR